MRSRRWARCGSRARKSTARSRWRSRTRRNRSRATTGGARRRDRLPRRAGRDGAGRPGPRRACTRRPLPLQLRRPTRRELAVTTRPVRGGQGRRDTAGVRHAHERVTESSQRCDDISPRPADGARRCPTAEMNDLVPADKSGVRHTHETVKRVSRFAHGRCESGGPCLIWQRGLPLREEIEGAYYHVGTRGNNQRDI